MLTLSPGSPGAGSSRWTGDGQNITRNTRWPVHAAAEKAFLTFTHLSAFYAYLPKKKIFLRQTFGENNLWELITLQVTSGIHHQWAQIHSALVGNSFRDYVIIGIVLGILVSLIQHWQLTYLVISGSSGMPWLCPRHRHCLRCLHCPGPHSPCSHLCRLCLLFITYFFQPRIYFVTAGVSFSGVRASDLFSCWHRASVSALSTQKCSWLLAVCHCFNQISLMSAAYSDSNQSPSPAWLHPGRLSPLSQFLSPLKSRQSWPWHGCTGGQDYCYSDEGIMEAKGSSPRMLQSRLKWREGTDVLTGKGLGWLAMAGTDHCLLIIPVQCCCCWSNIAL